MFELTQKRTHTHGRTFLIGLPRHIYDELSWEH
jgi:hypothetical protein